MLLPSSRSSSPSPSPSLSPDIDNIVTGSCSPMEFHLASRLCIVFQHLRRNILEPENKYFSSWEEIFKNLRIINFNDLTIPNYFQLHRHFSSEDNIWYSAQMTLVTFSFLQKTMFVSEFTLPDNSSMTMCFIGSHHMCYQRERWIRAKKTFDISSDYLINLQQFSPVDIPSS